MDRQVRMSTPVDMYLVLAGAPGVRLLSKPRWLSLYESNGEKHNHEMSHSVSDLRLALQARGAAYSTNWYATYYKEILLSISCHREEVIRLGSNE